MTGDRGLLVYFPMLSVPEGGWLARQLLYWDRLVVPTPAAVADEPEENFDDFTRELMSRDLVGYEFPENHFNVVHRVSAAFADSIDGTDLDVRRESMRSAPTFGLHGGKTSHDLLDHLRGRGLATEDRSGWWQVECTTAHEYMAAVSRAIADELHAVAVTDSDDAAAAVTGEVDVARLALLGDALPSPEKFDLEILEALRTHHDELAAFRDETERYAFLVARSETPAEADRWREEYRSRVEEAEQTLVRYMRSTARASRLVKGPYGALLAGRLGALVGALQVLPGFSRGVAPPDPDFTYSARARQELSR